MATIEGVMGGARTYLRDFPRFFADVVAKQDLSSTFDLSVKNLRRAGLAVLATDNSTVATGVPHTASFTASGTTFSYDVDEREGLVRIVTDRTGGMAGWAVNIEGYYFEWLADADLKYFAENVIAEHAYRRDSFCMEDVPDVEEDLLALGAAMESCFSLLAEFARDIDVQTPEAIGLPLTQRYRQIESLLFGRGGLSDKYKAKANLLGVGLERVEVFELRRRSRTTNRLVPVYREREWDDASRPVRVFPPINQLGPSTPPDSFLPAASVTGFNATPNA